MKYRILVTTYINREYHANAVAALCETIVPFETMAEAERFLKQGRNDISTQIDRGMGRIMTRLYPSL